MTDPPNQARPDPVVHRTMHLQVVRSLGLEILSGRLAPGEVLPPEPVLCDQLGVSRGALREAAKALMAKGLIELRPRTGTRVREEASWNRLDVDVLSWSAEIDRDATVTNLTEVRSLIEPGAAAYAATRATDAERAAISSAYQAMEAAADAREPGPFTDADVQFHQLLLAASHNPLLQALNRPFEMVLHTVFEITGSVHGLARETLTLHRDVAEAVTRRDASAAEWATRELIAASVIDFSTFRERERSPQPPDAGTTAPVAQGGPDH